MSHLLAAVVAAGALALGQVVVPVHEEPHHAPVLENTWVRVLDVRFGAGVESLFHRHALHNVAVRIVGGTTRADPVGGRGMPVHQPAGRVAFHSAVPPYVHRVVNVGTAPVRIVDVELFDGAPMPPAGGGDDPAGHATEIDNEQVRVRRVRLGPGESLAAHSHPHAWLDVVVSGARAGDVAWHAAGSRVPITARGATIEIVEIEPR